MKTTQPENFRKWLDALRSGEYNQTQKALHDSKGYCCLGVACEISNLGVWTEERPGLKTCYLTSDPEDAVGIGFLPASVAQWLGVGTRTLRGAGSGGHLFTVILGDGRDVSVVNDEGGDFGYIADLLEKEYL